MAELNDPETSRPLGIFALTFSCDQPGLRVGPRPLCSCGGHANESEAARCPEALAHARAFRS